MKIRIALAVLVLAFVPLTSHAAKKKKPLAVDVSTSPAGMPLVTLAASDAPLSEVAERLAAKLKTTIDVSPAARQFRVTTAVDQQPLDLALRELAPQVYVDGILSGGSTAKTDILSIHLRSAGETAPPVDEMQKRTSEVMMFFGNTEDEAVDPLEGQLDVTYRNDRLRVFSKKQPLSVVVYKLSEVLSIPLELIGDPRELVDLSLSDATVEQVMAALPSSVKLYHRKDLAAFRTTPVRLVVQVPFDEPATTNP
jgi:hypothetical protein